jgi:carbamoylphosphate synthase large subunit
MPKRTDIKTILVLGSGPIVIGQGCEFDYSGTQACKALKQEGYRIVLVNSNPATIMTDPQFSDRTYIEPITPEAVRKVIIKESTRRGAAGHPASGEPMKIDAILPTLGGQTALNCACALWDDGTLTEFGIEMIGANREVIHRAEDRQIFKDICEKIGLVLPKAKTVNTLEAAEVFLKEIGLPAIIRPAFTLGGSGGGIAYNIEEFREIVGRGLAASMITQVQIDQSVIGWKEYELEVVRDKHDNCIIVCGVENIDPMGVHTGDSITVAPILTLTDKEYQKMRDAAFAIMRAVGVETGGSNVQFAVNPNPKPRADGSKPFEMVVVEMNPRVSRSSALASKATGFPIAKIAAKLAVGYSLDELTNDITGTTSACFEPTIDYCVVKMPRWTFEKFPEADETLTTQMKSVGEAMAIGRTFKEALQKVMRSMDVKRFGFGLDRNDQWLEAMRAVKSERGVLDVVGGPSGGPPLRGGSVQASNAPQKDPSRSGGPPELRTADGQVIEWPIDWDKLARKLSVPSQGRFYYIRYAFKMGWSLEKVQGLTNIDPFFLDQMLQLVKFEETLCDYRTLEEVPAEVLFEAKQLGYSDAQLANLYLGDLKVDSILKVREHRKRLGIEPVYKLVDTCAAEFAAKTPYYYSTYERKAFSPPNRDRQGAVPSSQQAPADKRNTAPSDSDRSLTVAVPSEFFGDDEIRITDRKKVVILGGGPNRVGQGIEFDYCCCHAAYAAKEMGFESVMINSNPETVSTDYDTSDLLFFEPLTLEDVLNVIERLNGSALGLANFAGLEIDSKVGLPGIATLPTQWQAQLRDSLERAGCSRAAILGAAAQADGWYFDVATTEGTMCEVQFHPNSGHFVVTPSGFDSPERYLEAHSYAADVRRSVTEWQSAIHNVHGVIVQFGGQTPLNLAKGLVAAGAPIIGTSVDSIDRAEDRKRFDEVLDKLKLKRPAAGIAHSLDEAIEKASKIGYPVLIRPSYVLGGRGMEICYDEKALRSFMTTALETALLDDAPVLIDKFLDGAIEVDVDVVADFGLGTPTLRVGSSLAGSDNSANSTRSVGVPRSPTAVIAGILEQIEQAGIHSGDSACTLPPASLSAEIQGRIATLAKDMARELQVCGLMNIQLAVKNDEIYILEVNPRASRTVPFISKANHIPWPAIAAKAMMGMPLAAVLASGSLGGPPLRGGPAVAGGSSHRDPPPSGGPPVGPPKAPPFFAVKESVFPFSKFPGVDVVLGPEMRSTGEVMGIDKSLPIAFAKSQMAAGNALPVQSTITTKDGDTTTTRPVGVFISVRELDRATLVEPARTLARLGFALYSTEGTGGYLAKHGVTATILQKIGAGARPNVLDLMANGVIKLIINTPTRTGWKTDEGRIRATAVKLSIPMITTATAAVAAARAIEAMRAGDWDVAALQDYKVDSEVPVLDAEVKTIRATPAKA